MFSDLRALTSFGVGAGTVIYQMVNGEPVKAILVPVVGYSLDKAEEYFKTDRIRRIGGPILIGSLFAFPGAFVGYAIHSLGGKTFTAKTVAYLVGSGITYKALNIIADFGAEAAIRACR